MTKFGPTVLYITCVCIMRPPKFAIIPSIWVCSVGHRYFYTFSVGESSVVFSGSSYRRNKRKWLAHTYEADVAFTSTGISDRGRVPLTNTYFVSPIIFCIPIPDFQKSSTIAYLTLYRVSLALEAPNYCL